VIESYLLAELLIQVPVNILQMSNAELRLMNDHVPQFIDRPIGAVRRQHGWAK
jgi:hypothetical protein